MEDALNLPVRDLSFREGRVLMRATVLQSEDLAIPTREDDGFPVSRHLVEAPIVCTILDPSDADPIRHRAAPR
jgi:hypothetical protein